MSPTTPARIPVIGRAPAPRASVSFEQPAVMSPPPFDAIAALDRGDGKSVNVAAVLEGQTWLGPTPARGVRPAYEEVERQHAGPTRLDPPDDLMRAVRRARR